MSTPCKQILLVEDDEVFRGLLKKALELGGYEVIIAPNGKAAESLFGLSEIAAVLSDVNMLGGDGIALTQFVKASFPKIPIVLMTGFLDLKETVEAAQKGADAFIAKPFKKEDLLYTLENLIKKVEEQIKAEIAPPSIDDQFCKLSIADFVSGKEIKFDVYLRLSELKYVKIAHQGEDIPVNRIKAFQEKNIKFLHLKKDDFRKYIGLNVTLVPAVNKSRSVSIEKKVNFLKHTHEIILEQVFHSDIDEEHLEQSKLVVETTVELLLDSPATIDLLGFLRSIGDYTYAHSVGVTMFSVMIARELNWKSPANLYKISMGAMLHDIGKKELDPTLLKKSRREMNSDEIKIYESHTVRGMEILGKIPSVPSDILQIAGQHHEICNGQGYPMALSKNRIHPMARVVTLANEFCEFAIKNPNGPGMQPKEALKQIIQVDATRYDNAALMALIKIVKSDLKLPPPASEVSSP